MNIETTTKRKPSDGVALASIVAKETTEGKWSGSGGGLGLGPGGLGLFVGGMTGTKRDQTLRAKEFQPPKKDEFRLMKVVGPMVALAAFGLLFSCSGQVLNSVADTGFAPTGNLGRVNQSLQAVMDVLLFVVPVVAVFGAAIWYVFGSDKRSQREHERHEAAKRQDESMQSVYYRLRYVEADHVVFDPVSGMETPATRENIMTMLRTLSASMNTEKG